MVTFINSFHVPAGRDDEFFVMWQVVNAHMAGREGLIGHRLHKSLSPDAASRFINVAEWESIDAWRAAHDGAFRALVGAPEWADFPSTPALYEVVHSSDSVSV